jgi:hypothetical protein
MSIRNKNLLTQLIKSWAQDHSAEFNIADPDKTDQGTSNTASYFTWLVQEKLVNINLLSLVDRLEVFMEDAKYKKGLDGFYCCKCTNFFQFAEPNQEDGTLICYSCRQRGY